MFAFTPVSSFAGLALNNGQTILLAKCRRHNPTLSPISMSSKVLIVNTKGGGHGHIGLHLARGLLENGHAVDMLQMGSETTKGPVGKYPELSQKYSEKFSVRFGSVSDEVDGTGYDAVYDNNAKSVEDAALAIKAGKHGAEVFYVSSAGAYTYDKNVAPHIVGDSAKGATIDVEKALRDNGVSSVNFRPTYIIGEGSSKREYTDYFFDRIVRNKPVLLPGTGSELTALTDVRDVASMLVAALGKRMRNETLNMVNTRCITFDGIVKICEAVCEKKAEIVYYDPDEMKNKVDGFQVKKAFPFRPRHFFADPGESQSKLGWAPVYSGTKEGLTSTLQLCYDEYVALGLGRAEVDFSTDEKILSRLRVM